MIETTTVGETSDQEVWWGGREGYRVWEDDWALDNSWYFSKCVQRSLEYSLNAHVKLLIWGGNSGRCRPTRASAWLAFGSDKNSSPRVDLGEISIRSIKKAQEWAESLATPSALKVLYQTFHSTFEPLKKKGVLFEAFNKELGWHEFFWAFDPYFRDLPAYGVYRTTDHEGRVTLYQNRWSAWSSSSWPSRWDLIARPPWRGSRDEYGAL